MAFYSLFNLPMDINYFYVVDAAKNKFVGEGDGGVWGLLLLSVTLEKTCLRSVVVDIKTYCVRLTQFVYIVF